jgi:hypothetical protein
MAFRPDHAVFKKDQPQPSKKATVFDKELTQQQLGSFASSITFEESGPKKKKKWKKV